MRQASAECRHGTFSYFDGDTFVGRSLARYGEFSEDEVTMLRKCLRPGGIVIEVGANIGALTVPMAKLVGPTGKVIAFEPHPETCKLLRQNVERNGVSDVVTVVNDACGAAQGFALMPDFDAEAIYNVGGAEVKSIKKAVRSVKANGDASHDESGGVMVPVSSVDEFAFERVNFMKIDAEGSELDVIKGAVELIKRDRPILYVENDREDKSAELIAAILDLGYRLYWHRPPLFNPDNFRGEPENVFGNIVSLNMLGVHEQSNITVTMLDEVADLRMDAQIYDREIARYRRILTHNPNDMTARMLVAHYSNLMQRGDDAYAMLDENLRLDPSHVATRAMRGLMDLQRGDYSQWPVYELRYAQKSTASFGGHRLQHRGLKWDGKPTEEPVLIWSEQGFGDEIMFGRFIPDVFERAPNAFVEVKAQLFELFEHSKLVPPGRMIRAGRTLPDYTLHCSIPSLPAVLGVGNQVQRPPYLHAEPNMVRLWQARQHPRYGLCTRGSSISERPYSRDIPPEAIAPIVERWPMLSLDQDGQFESYADTAAAIADLDIVITVDTSIAHLAGAMGRPVWLLLSFDPDWRWGLKSAHSIWYPSMHILRQHAMFDWSRVIDQLSKLIEAREPKRNEEAERMIA